MTRMQPRFAGTVTMVAVILLVFSPAAHPQAIRSSGEAAAAVVEAAAKEGQKEPQPGADVKDKLQHLLQQLQTRQQNAKSRIAEYEREFQRQLNFQRASGEGTGLNDKVRHLHSRLERKYPEGLSAEFQREFLRGLEAIQQQPESESRIAEYEREFQRQLNFQRASGEGTGLNDKVRQLQSRLERKYPEGRSAEFQREFLRGLEAIQQQPESESRIAEYEREFQRQLNAHGP